MSGKEVNVGGILKEAAEVGLLGGLTAYAADRWVFGLSGTGYNGWDRNVACGITTGAAILVGESLHAVLDAKDLNPLSNLPGGEMVVVPTYAGGAVMLMDRFAPTGDESEGYGRAFLKGAGCDVVARMVAPSVFTIQSLPIFKGSS